GGAPQRLAQQPEAETRHRCFVELAKRHILGHRHRGYSGVLQRLLGQAEDLEMVEVVTFGLEVLVADEDLAKLDGTLAGERLHKLALAVAGYARNADDLASLDLEIETRDRLPALIVLSEEPSDLKRHATLGRGCARSRWTHNGVSDHHRRHLSRRDGADLAAANLGAASQHREVVAERLDLAKLMAD